MDVGQIMGNLGFDWRMALANLANFLIIFWILKRYAFKPIAEKLKAREDKINKGLEDAEKAATELTMSKQKGEETVMEARSKANGIVAAAHEESEKIVAKAKADGEEKTKELLEKAKKVIEGEKIKMLAELKAEVVGLVVSAVEKIVTKEMDKESQEKLIKQMLEKDEV